MNFQKTGLLLTMHNEVSRAIDCVKSYERNFNHNIRIIGNDSFALNELSKYFDVDTQFSHNIINRMHIVEGVKYKVDVTQLAFIIIDLLESYYNQCSEIQAKFIISLHPDHLVFKSFDKMIGKYDMEISLINEYDAHFKSDFGSITGFKGSLTKFGLPGYIHRTKLLRTVEFVRHKNYSLLHKLVAKNPRFIYEDSLFPLLFEYQGFKVGNQGITYEMGRKHRSILRYFNHYLLHQVPNDFKLPTIRKLFNAN